MDSTVPIILRLVSSSIHIAKRAGGVIRSVVEEGNLCIVEKGVNDYQTKADRAAQLCILASFDKMFPNVTVIAEEENICPKNCSFPEEWICEKQDQDVLNITDYPSYLKDVKPEEVTVWVDPLDGTSEFTKGALDHVTVLIGIAVGENTVAGVIHQPYYSDINGLNQNGRTIWGIIGVGSGNFVTTRPPVNCKVVVTSKSHITPVVHKAAQCVKADSVLQIGGSGYKVVALLDGIAHAYIYASPGTKKWDTCAPEAVLQACGGMMTDIFGNTYKYNKSVNYNNLGGILATAIKTEHQYYLNCMTDDIKTQMLKNFP